LLELLASNLDLPKTRLQGPNLVLCVLQVVLEVILMLVKVYNVLAIYPEVMPSYS
jgi:hypothetical protein